MAGIWGEYRYGANIERWRMKKRKGKKIRKRKGGVGVNRENSGGESEEEKSLGRSGEERSEGTKKKILGKE